MILPKGKNMTNIDFFYNNLWSSTLQEIHDSKKVSEDVFDLYFSNSKLAKIDETKATIVVPNFIAKTLMLNESYLIEECFKNIYGTSIPINITTEDDLNSLVAPIEKNDFFDKSLDINQNFSNFIFDTT